MLRTTFARSTGSQFHLLALSLQLLVGLPAARTTAASSVMLHTKARQEEYQGGAKRFPVPDDKVPWAVEWPGYQPVDYSAPVLFENRPWADPEIRKGGVPQPLKFNTLDAKVDRRSHAGEYAVVDGVPRNPMGRTGMIGRGLLGRWGPNHAADPIVSRWKRNPAGEKVSLNGKTVMEFVAIKRRDTGSWAIPGGMVEAGDTVSATLKKEFGEEAMNSLEAGDEEKKDIEAHVNELFKHGTKIYAGYVDDPRNTDNAWMETVAVNFHDEAGDAFSKVNLEAGDDAGAVAWIEASSKLDLYASHTHFIQEVVKLRNAAW